MDFRILNFDEGVFMENKDFVVPKDKEITVNVNLRPVFRYTLVSDIVVCQLTLTYFHDETELLRYGFAVASVLKGWSEFIHSNPEREAIINNIWGVWNASVNVGRGIFIEMIKATEFKQFLIPDIPVERFDTILSLEQEDKNDRKEWTRFHIHTQQLEN